MNIEPAKNTHGQPLTTEDCKLDHQQQQLDGQQDIPCCRGSFLGNDICVTFVYALRFWRDKDVSLHQYKDSCHNCPDEPSDDHERGFIDHIDVE